MKEFATGFMSEHTAEYVLVPDLVRSLSEAFARVVPFFFSASREGQVKAQLSYQGEVRLLCAYARRPKVNYPGDEAIYIKFNELLFHHAHALEQEGIPLVAGAPCASRLTDVQLGIECVWFHIKANKQGWHDTFTKVNVTSQKQVEIEEPESPVKGPLRGRDICKLASESCKHVVWSEALTRLAGINRDLKRGTQGRDYWMGGRYLPYKPFYLALLEDADK